MRSEDEVGSSVSDEAERKEPSADRLGVAGEVRPRARTALRVARMLVPR
jgi:hypothetical protein